MKRRERNDIFKDVEIFDSELCNHYSIPKKPTEAKLRKLVDDKVDEINLLKETRNIIV